MTVLGGSGPVSLECSTPLQLRHGGGMTAPGSQGTVFLGNRMLLQL